jgi:hypothetical protein
VSGADEEAQRESDQDQRSSRHQINPEKTGIRLFHSAAVNIVAAGQEPGEIFPLKRQAHGHGIISTGSNGGRIMFWRNLLFIGVILIGAVALGWTLLPRAVPTNNVRFDPQEGHDTADRLDAAFAANWKAFDPPITPVRRADDLTIMRRLSLALVGTVPSLHEIRQFEAHDEKDRIEWYTAQLLADRRFADYWGERLARAFVGTENGPFVVYRRRRFVSWLSDQIHANRPYDQIVRDMIASKGLWTDSPATNFVTVTIELDNQKGPDAERLAGRTTRAFLGLRLDCAQCHKHPFASWKQEDFQGLAAMYGQTKQGFTGIYDDAKQKYSIEVREKMSASADGEVRMVSKTIEPTVPFHPEWLPQHGTPREKLAAWITHPQNEYFSKAIVNRVWGLMFGKPMVEPVDDVNSTDNVPAALRLPLKLLADDFVAHQFDLRRLIKVIIATRVFHLDSADSEEITDVHNHYLAVFPMTRLRPEQIGGSVIQAASVQTVNNDSHVVTRVVRFVQERDFVERYGDTGDDEFDGREATIPQGLLMMNGELVKERTKDDGPFNATAQIAGLAGSDEKAVEVAYLTVLTRRPTVEELEYFVKKMKDQQPRGRNPRAVRRSRAEVLEDLCWTLLQSTEFNWNH